MGIYKRGDNYYIRFQVGGKKLNISAHTTKEAEALDLEKKLKEQQRKKLLGITIDMPLASAISEYIKYMRQGHSGLKESSIKRYEVSFGQVLNFLADDMVSDMSKQWISQYIERRREAKPALTNRTLRRDLDALSLVFKFLKSNMNAIERNAVREYDFTNNLPEMKKEIRVPSVKEIQTIIDDMGPMLGRIAAFQALTGLRQQEALQLEWRDVDLERSELVISKTKTSSPRSVVMFKEAVKILKALPKPPKGDYVFWHGDGERYKRFANQWKSFTKRLKIPVRDHDLRHFYANLYLTKGGTLPILMLQMGHKNYETTLQYSHLSTDNTKQELIRMREYELSKELSKKLNTDVTFIFPDAWKYEQQKHPGWEWKKRKQDADKIVL